MNKHAVPETDAESTGVGWWLGRIVSWTVLLFVVAILLAAIVVPKIGGGQPYTVLTSSMEPTYPPGTLIVTRKVDANALGVGQAITFQIRSGEPDVITHRIISSGRDQDGNASYTTQGDNNPYPDDEKVRPVQVRGAVWYSIPYLGYVNNWITGERRSIFVAVVAGGLIVFALWQFAGALHGRARREESE